MDLSPKVTRRLAERPQPKMRHNGQQFRARGDQNNMRVPEPPRRKVFNCIVDDTALLAGVKRSTRDGIKKWVNMGAIRLFVPLYTLSQLDRLKKADRRISTDAKEAIKWLDDVTSLPDVQTTGIVQLQGVDQLYETWAQVEKFILPETLLSAEDPESDLDSLTDELESNLDLQTESDHASLSSQGSVDLQPKTPSSPRSTYSSTSPGLLNVSPYKPIQSASSISSTQSQDRAAPDSAEFPGHLPQNKSVVPPGLQPLFNHVLWRIHQEPTTSDIDPYILLTNDPICQSIGQRFGIRSKRLEQLRDAISREERDYRNRMTLHKKETAVATGAIPSPKSVTAPPKSTKDEESDEEDVVVLKPRNAGSQRVIDPNDFARGPPKPSPTPRGGRGGHGGRGGRGGRGGGFRGSRGGFPPPTVGRGRASAIASDLSKPIDPNFYGRPPPSNRGFGAGARKLWQPT